MPLSPRQRLSRGLVRTIGVLGVLAGAAACHKAAEATTGTSATAPVTVTVQTVKARDLRDTIVAQGTVVPNPAAIFTVVAPESSKIVELPKPEGSKVEPGDVVARFDFSSQSSSLSAKPADVTAAEKKLDQAKAEFTKQDGLFAKGYTPRNTYEAAKTAVESAQKALDQLNAETTAATALNDRAVARAPFAGIVQHVVKSVGDVADLASNATVLQVVDPTRVQAAVLVTPSQELRIMPGQPATVTTSGGSDSQPATVIIAPPVLGTESASTVEVRLSLTGAVPPPLATAITAEIVVERRDHVVVVPESAVAKDDVGAYVMIAGADGHAHRRDVHVGLVVSHLAEIQSGLTEGDEVIVSNLDQVADNAAIQIDRGR